MTGARRGRTGGGRCGEAAAAGTVTVRRSGEGRRPERIHGCDWRAPTRARARAVEHENGGEEVARGGAGSCHWRRELRAGVHGVSQRGGGLLDGGARRDGFGRFW